MTAPPKSARPSPTTLPATTSPSWSAARGLDERDQLVLELSVRQGLGGQDLADALGVSTNQSYTLVHRMRERVERSLAAYVVAKAGRNDCGDLDKLLGKWDGEFTVLIRKRVSRHVDNCEVCDSRRRRVAPLAMFGTAPVYAAPAALRDQILGAASLQAAAPSTPYLFTARDGFPQVVRAARRVAAGVAPTAAASLVLVVSGLSFLWLDSTDGDDGLIREAGGGVEVTTTESTTTTTGPPTTSAPVGTNFTRVAEVAPSPTAPESTPASTPATGSVIDPTKAAPNTTQPATTRPSAPTQSTPATTRASTTPTPTPAPTPTPTPTLAPTPSPTPGVTTTTTTAPPRPGQLTVSGGSIDLGSTARSGSVTVTNMGDLPLDFTVVGNPAPFSVSPTAGTLAGGASATVTASINRSEISEGSTAGSSVQVFGAGSTFNVNLSASGPENPPVLRNPSVNGFCSASVEISGTVSIADASGVGSATLSVSGPGGQSGSTSMSNGSNGWFGNVSVFYEPNDPASASGSWSWTITANDTRGNTASTSGSLSITC